MKAARSLGRRDYREAIRLYEEHLEANPEDWFDISMIAECYVKLGDDEQGIEWGTRALAIQADYTAALELLTGCYTRQGDHDRAYQCVCRALELPEPAPADIPGFVMWIFKVVSLIPKFRKSSPAQVQAGQDRIARQHAEWRHWAKGYKAWYEAQWDGSSPHTKVR